jgi:hypothetical protein
MPPDLVWDYTKYKMVPVLDFDENTVLVANPLLRYTFDPLPDEIKNSRPPNQSATVRCPTRQSPDGDVNRFKR